MAMNTQQLRETNNGILSRFFLLLFAVARQQQQQRDADIFIFQSIDTIARARSTRREVTASEFEMPNSSICCLSVEELSILNSLAVCQSWTESASEINEWTNEIGLVNWRSCAKKDVNNLTYADNCWSFCTVLHGVEQKKMVKAAAAKKVVKSSERNEDLPRDCDFLLCHMFWYKFTAAATVRNRYPWRYLAH